MRVLYFAWVRERIGTGEETLSPSAEVTNVGGLIDWLAERSESHRLALAERDRLRAAVDGEFVPLDASIRGAEEVAIFPPVTGG
jgi:sulfur-carrier protein